MEITPLLSLSSSLGLSNEAIATTLAAASGRPAPSPQRVQDWLAGKRPTPLWVLRAAADHLCRLWLAERNTVSEEQLPRCDAAWAGRLDRMLGEMYAVHATVPPDVRQHLRSLTACIRKDVRDRLTIDLPGV